MDVIEWYCRGADYQAALAVYLSIGKLEMNIC